LLGHQPSLNALLPFRATSEITLSAAVDVKLLQL
jgi:hypothetical protein